MAVSPQQTAVLLFKGKHTNRFDCSMVEGAWGGVEGRSVVSVSASGAGLRVHLCGRGGVVQVIDASYDVICVHNSLCASFCCGS